jgi:hypothetical protein
VVEVLLHGVRDVFEQGLVELARYARELEHSRLGQ